MSPPISVDDLEHMVAYIYNQRNAETVPTAAFAHSVEVCGALTSYDRGKDRGTLTTTNVLCKALGWFFPLMAKFRVSSVAELIYRKYPFCCPYCLHREHQEKACKSIRGVERTLNHAGLRREFERNASIRPVTLDEWQGMFQTIYQRQSTDVARSSLGLFEEIGELAEAVRVFERHPKYFAGEAADVFSYLMGAANEHMLREAQEDREFSYEAEFLRRYPGLCLECGHAVCVCPPIPEATVGRMAKEVDIAPGDPL